MARTQARARGSPRVRSWFPGCASHRLVSPRSARSPRAGARPRASGRTRRVAPARRAGPPGSRDPVLHGRSADAESRTRGSARDRAGPRPGARVRGARQRRGRRELGVAPWKVPCGLTRTTYNRGCRCKKCRRINADAQLAYIAKHPERFKATQDRCRTKALASAPHTGEDATVSKYTLGCRCDGCCAARKKWADANRASRLAKILVEHPIPHAPTTISWYTTGCRCEDCRTLMREHGRRLRSGLTEHDLQSLDLSAL